MDRRHYINKFGWEALSSLSLAVLGASVIGMLLTHLVSAKLGSTVLIISAAILATSIVLRASLQAKEDSHE